MMKALDEINSDSFQSFKLRIGKDVVQFHAFQTLSVATFIGSETLWMLWEGAMCGSIWCHYWHKGSLYIGTSFSLLKICCSFPKVSTMGLWCRGWLELRSPSMTYGGTRSTWPVGWSPPVYQERYRCVVWVCGVLCLYVCVYTYGIYVCVVCSSMFTNIAILPFPHLHMHAHTDSWEHQGASRVPWPHLWVPRGCQDEGEGGSQDLLCCQEEVTVTMHSLSTCLMYNMYTVVVAVIQDTKILPHCKQDT